MKETIEKQNLNKSNERFEKSQLSKPAPTHASTGRTGSISLSTSTLRGISKWKIENGKWKVSLDDLLPAQFIYPWKIVLNELDARKTSPCHSERLCAGMSCCATPAPATEESSLLKTNHPFNQKQDLYTKSNNKLSWIIGSSQLLCSAFVFPKKNNAPPSCSQGRHSVRGCSLQPCQNPLDSSSPSPLVPLLERDIQSPSRRQSSERQGLASLAQDCFITTFKPLINLTLIHLLTSKRKEVNYAKH